MEARAAVCEDGAEPEVVCLAVVRAGYGVPVYDLVACCPEFCDCVFDGADDGRLAADDAVVCHVADFQFLCWV